MIYSIDSSSFVYRCGCGSTEEFLYNALTLGVALANSRTGDDKKNCLIVELGSCACGMERFLKGRPQSVRVSGLAANFIVEAVRHDGSIHADYVDADIVNQMGGALYLDDYESLPISIYQIQSFIHLSAALTKMSSASVKIALNMGELIHGSEASVKAMLDSVAISADNKAYLYARHGYSVA